MWKDKEKRNAYHRDYYHTKIKQKRYPNGVNWVSTNKLSIKCPFCNSFRWDFQFNYTPIEFIIHFFKGRGKIKCVPLNDVLTNSTDNMRDIYLSRKSSLINKIKLICVSFLRENCSTSELNHLFNTLTYGSTSELNHLSNILTYGSISELNYKKSQEGFNYGK